MRKFLITAHGKLASGIKSSLDIIIGETENVFVIDAYVDGNKSIEDELKKILENIKPEDELIVFSDLMGGSITNQVLRCALKENVHVVSGMNLPLLIDLIMADTDLPVTDTIENSLKAAREQIVYVNKLINQSNAHD
jgi:fructoselysine and glucoselysine-specific PTS system IIA component